MSLFKGYIVPHPPLLVMGTKAEKSKLTETLKSYKKISEELATSQAELIVLITPHGPLFVDGICVYDQPNIVGNFSSFGHKEITGTWDNNLTFIQYLQDKCSLADIPFVKLDPQIVKEFNLSSDLDHGAMVPLKLLEQGIGSKKVVVINYGLLSVDSLYRFGQLITETLRDMNQQGVVIASGDLSHYLSDEGPYGYREEGVHFDHQYVKAFTEDDWESLLFVDKDLLEKAGECGKRSIEVLLGAFDTYDYETETLSYEAPYGVGYLTGLLQPTQLSGTSRLPKILERQKIVLQENMANESPVVQLARKSIQLFLTEERTYHPEKLLEIEKAGQRSGVFVSLKDVGGLRGCMGSTGGIAPTVEEEIVDMAIKAATKDPRFNPVSIDELDSLTISVDILSQPEQVLETSELDPKKYGVMVKSNHKHGLLLPDLEGITSVEEQLKIVLNKAGINPAYEAYELYKFTVKRFY